MRTCQRARCSDEDGYLLKLDALFNVGFLFTSFITSAEHYSCALFHKFNVSAVFNEVSESNTLTFINVFTFISVSYISVTCCIRVSTNSFIVYLIWHYMCNAGGFFFLQ